MVFITAGMGGGTGTGAAPGGGPDRPGAGLLTVGIVTKPFAFEGRRRMEQAEKGIAALREQVDSLVVIPNERLKLVSEERITLANAFIVADDAAPGRAVHLRLDSAARHCQPGLRGR